MTVKELYQNIQGNYEEAKQRMLTEEMIERCIKYFAVDTSYHNMVSALEKEDMKASFDAAHKLKGITGNLAFGELYELTRELTNQLRPQTTIPDNALVERVEICYQKVMGEIVRFEEEKR